jgi:hypothetical protein
MANYIHILARLDIIQVWSSPVVRSYQCLIRASEHSLALNDEPVVRAFLWDQLEHPSLMRLQGHFRYGRVENADFAPPARLEVRSGAKTVSLLPKVENTIFRIL